MPTNVIGKNSRGRSFNHFEKIEVSAADFADTADVVITFPTQTVSFLLEENSGAIEYSFNGNDLHGDMDALQASKGLTFDNRVVCPIWFRVRSGSTGPLTVRIEAWGTR